MEFETQQCEFCKPHSQSVQFNSESLWSSFIHSLPSSRISNFSQNCVDSASTVFVSILILPYPLPILQFIFSTPSASVLLAVSKSTLPSHCGLSSLPETAMCLYRKDLGRSSNLVHWTERRWSQHKPQHATYVQAYSLPRWRGRKQENKCQDTHGLP